VAVRARYLLPITKICLRIEASVSDAFHSSQTLRILWHLPFLQSISYIFLLLLYFAFIIVFVVGSREVD